VLNVSHLGLEREGPSALGGLPRGGKGERTSNVAFLVLVREVFQRPLLRLRNEERREDTGQHEEGKDFHDVLDELVLATNVDKLAKAKLGNNGAELSGGSGDTVCCRAVTRGEGFAGNDEGGRVGTEVLEEVGEAVEEHERVGARLC